MKEKKDFSGLLLSIVYIAITITLVISIHHITQPQVSHIKKHLPHFRQMPKTDTMSNIIRNYVKKPTQVKGRLFELGDQDGFVEGVVENNETGKAKKVKAPFVRCADGTRQFAEFGTHYVLIFPDGSKSLKSVAKFLNEYECLDY